MIELPQAALVSARWSSANRNRMFGFSSSGGEAVMLFEIREQQRTRSKRWRGNRMMQ